MRVELAPDALAHRSRADLALTGAGAGGDQPDQLSQNRPRVPDQAQGRIRGANPSWVGVDVNQAPGEFQRVLARGLGAEFGADAQNNTSPVEQFLEGRIVTLGNPQRVDGPLGMPPCP